MLCQMDRLHHTRQCQHRKYRWCLAPVDEGGLQPDLSVSYCLLLRAKEARVSRCRTVCYRGAVSI